MIFSNKIYKISSGENISIFADSNQKISLFVFKNLTEEKEITFSPAIKCVSLPGKYSYNKVKKINSLHSLICLDKFISIIEN